MGRKIKDSENSTLKVEFSDLDSENSTLKVEFSDSENFIEVPDKLIKIRYENNYALKVSAKDFYTWANSYGAGISSVYTFNRKIKQAHERISSDPDRTPVEEWFTYHGKGKNGGWRLTQKGALRISLEFRSPYFQRVKDILVEKFIEGEIPRQSYLKRKLEWVFDWALEKYGGSMTIGEMKKFFDEKGFNITDEDDKKRDAYQLQFKKYYNKKE